MLTSLGLRFALCALSAAFGFFGLSYCIAWSGLVTAKIASSFGLGSFFVVVMVTLSSIVALIMTDSNRVVCIALLATGLAWCWLGLAVGASWPWRDHAQGANRPSSSCPEFPAQARSAIIDTSIPHHEVYA